MNRCVDAAPGAIVAFNICWVTVFISPMRLNWCITDSTNCSIIKVKSTHRQIPAAPYYVRSNSMLISITPHLNITTNTKSFVSCSFFFLLLLIPFLLMNCTSFHYKINCVLFWVFQLEMLLVFPIVYC